MAHRATIHEELAVAGYVGRGESDGSSAIVRTEGQNRAGAGPIPMQAVVVAIISTSCSEAHARIPLIASYSFWGAVVGQECCSCVAKRDQD